MGSYELRDPIHNRILFDEFERRVIDHPFFQRLRYISQLSFVSHVYPGGVHNRFGHALGAMFVAGRLFDRFFVESDVLRASFSAPELDRLRRRLRLAGLLHDLGHGPFSHASETIFPALADLPLNWSWWTHLPDRQAKHEDYSVLLIQTLAQEQVLEMSLAQDVASLVHPDILPSADLAALEERAPGLPIILRALVTGEVDCDRLDYLLRDSYYCGVYYGHYDFNWLLSSLDLAQVNSRLVFTLTENGVRAFEDMLLARYHMIDQVYFHKTAAGFAHYLLLAIQNREIDLHIPADPYLYADMHDGRVLELLAAAAKDPKNYWSKHLIERLPAKRFLRLEQGSPEDQATLMTLIETCEREHIGYFTHAARQQLSHLNEGTGAAGLLYVNKKTLQGQEYLPIFNYSDLLQKYNRKIDFTDFFILREDWRRFSEIFPAKT